MTYAIAFLYETSDAAAFERAYAPDGEWARFFARAAGYHGTELLRDGGATGRYLLLDRWESRDAYDAFLRSERAEYERRSRESASLYDREELLGAFEAP